MPFLFDLTTDGHKELRDAVEHIKEFTTKTSIDRKYNPEIFSIALLTVATKIAVFENKVPLEVFLEYVTYSISLNELADELKGKREASKIINEALKEIKE